MEERRLQGGRHQHSHCARGGRRGHLDLPQVSRLGIRVDPLHVLGGQGDQYSSDQPSWADSWGDGQQQHVDHHRGTWSSWEQSPNLDLSRGGRSYKEPPQGVCAGPQGALPPPPRSTWQVGNHHRTTRVRQVHSCRADCQEARLDLLRGRRLPPRLQPLCVPQREPGWRPIREKRSFRPGNACTWSCAGGLFGQWGPFGKEPDNR